MNFKLRFLKDDYGDELKLSFKKSFFRFFYGFVNKYQKKIQCSW